MANILKRFFEAGKRNSASDAKKLQAAHDALVEAGAMCATPAKEALRVDDSFDARRQAISQAARALFIDPTQPYDSPYCYVRDLFDADVVVDCDGEIYQIPYSLDADGVVTLGTPVEVDIAYIPSDDSNDDISERKIPAGARYKKSTPNPGAIAEAAVEELTGDFIEIREGAVAADGSAEICIIKPGWGSSGHYSAELLKRDGPKVFTKDTQMFWNHQTDAEEAARPEGSLDNLASKLTANAKWQEAGAEGPGLYAPINVYPTFRDPVNDLAKDIGVSIRAAGTYKEGTAEGRTGRIIEKIANAKSIDYVTKPGAGGKILQLFEAARTRTPNPIQENTVEKVIAPVIDTQLTERVALQEKTIAALLHSALLSEARTFITSQLATKATALPSASQQRVASDLAKQEAPIKEGRVDVVALEARITEAVSAEAAYIGVITGAGQVKGVGATEIADTAKSLAESEKSLNASFAELGLSE